MIVGVDTVRHVKDLHISKIQGKGECCRKCEIHTVLYMKKFDTKSKRQNESALGL